MSRTPALCRSVRELFLAALKECLGTKRPPFNTSLVRGQGPALVQQRA